MGAKSLLRLVPGALPVIVAAPFLLSCDGSPDQTVATGGGKANKAVVYTIITDNTMKAGQNLGKKDWFIKVLEEANAGRVAGRAPLAFEAVKEDDWHKVISKTIKSDGAPALYHAWSGYAVSADVRNGLAEDLTPLFQSEKWTERMAPSALHAARVGDKYYFVPQWIDISNVLWYNPALLKKHGVESDPATWTFDDLVAHCRALAKKEVTPIALGNKDGWVLGNFAAHLLSRSAGEGLYADVLALKPGTKLANPEFVKGLGLLKQLAAVGAFSRGVAEDDADTAIARFLAGQAAMCAIGSWLPADHQPIPIDVRCVNLPPVAGGKGDQKSVILSVTGYLAGKGSGHLEGAKAFLARFLSDEKQREWAEYGFFSPLKGVGFGARSEPCYATLTRLITEPATVVDPPDTGYSHAVADALYAAAADVVAGSEPEAALAKADESLAAHRALGE
ncbi:MAG: extracellular solute-binding protein [Planctomycetes bacterium]|nr:extracellular solute-binding protein [Planctomycetota bacterium]